MIFSRKSLPLLSSAVEAFLGPKHSSVSGALSALGNEREPWFGAGKAVWEEGEALGSEKMDRTPRFSKSRIL